MKTTKKRSILHGLTAMAMILAMGLGLGACSQTGPGSQSRVYSNRAEVREAPAMQTKTTTTAPTAGTGYSEKNRTEFMAGCKQSCANKDKTKETAAFCEMYCDCTHAGLRMKVPYTDLQALGEGKKPKSTETIVNIQNQCLRDAAGSQAKKTLLSRFTEAERPLVDRPR